MVLVRSVCRSRVLPERESPALWFPAVGLNETLQVSFDGHTFRFGAARIFVSRSGWMARLMSSPAFALWLQLYDRCSTKNHWFSAESAGCRRYKIKGTMLGPSNETRSFLAPQSTSKMLIRTLCSCPRFSTDFHRPGVRISLDTYMPDRKSTRLNSSH